MTPNYKPALDLPQDDDTIDFWIWFLRRNAALSLMLTLLEISLLSTSLIIVQYPVNRYNTLSTDGLMVEYRMDILPTVSWRKVQNDRTSISSQ